MKVSIFSAFYPFRGGIAQFSALLYRSIEKKHSVQAFTFKRQYPNFLFPGQTQLVTEKDIADKIPATRVLDSMNPFSFISSASAIKNSKSDIYISNYWMSFFGPSMGIIARLIPKKTKQISILHNVIPHEKRFFDIPLNKFFLSKTDGFIVMSDAVLNDLISLKPDAKYLRIDHPVYTHFGEKIDQKTAQQTLNLATDKKTLLFFGLIRNYKGLDLLLEAFNLLDSDYQLVIAGEVYGSFEKYDAIIKNSPNKEQIHLNNRYINDDEVATFFSAADVCILPYKSATQSGITAISNHFCLPIIATDVGGLKETIHHNKTGLIVETPNSLEIKQSIDSYFINNLKENFSLAIQKENELKSWDNFAEKLIQFSETI